MAIFQTGKMTNMNTSFIFDLDGTIVITEQYHCEAFRNALKQFGIKYNYDIHKKNYTGTGDKEIAISELKKHRLPLEYTDQVVKSKQKIYMEIVKAKKIPLVKGIKEFLEKAKSLSIKLAVATSTTKNNAKFLLEKTDLLKYFSAVFTVETVKRAKPDPQIFIYASKKLEVTPQETVIFEDSPRGIEAGERGGFTTVGITTTASAKELLSKGADFIAADYTQIDINDILMLKNLRGMK